MSRGRAPHSGPRRPSFAAFASLVVGFAAAGAAFAEPDFQRPQRAAGLTLYPDSVDSRVFYYPPSGISLATSSDGAPEFAFLSIVYTGAAASGDRGRILHRNSISFRVLLQEPEPARLKQARRELASGRAKLRPLQIQALDSAVVYTPVGPAAETMALPAGHFEGPAGDARAFWRERQYTLALDNESADLFMQAMKRGRIAMSVGWAFHASGRRSDEPLVELQGAPELVEALRNAASAPARSETQIVQAGALEIAIDPERWPQLFRRIELDGNVPPGYALLEIRCYDFQTRRSDDLHEKQVDVEATAVGGGPVQQSVSFRRSAPDLHTASLRFPFAVLPERAYRYRVTDWYRDGSSRIGPWLEVEDWDLLDVTSPVEAVPEDAGP